MLLLLLALVCGYAIFAGLFVCAAGLQFFLVNGAEMTNAFTYGGRYAAAQPASVWSPPLKLLFGFVFPRCSPPTCRRWRCSACPARPAARLARLVRPAGRAVVWLMGLLLWRWGYGTTREAADDSPPYPPSSPTA